MIEHFFKKKKVMQKIRNEICDNFVGSKKLSKPLFGSLEGRGREYFGGLRI